MRRRRAFSLSEVLAVVSIMAALGAILFPVFARARESARRSVCVSNLHQFGIAIDMYRRDWDGQEQVKGVRMSHSALGLPYRANPLWTGYIPNEAIRTCPSKIPDAGWSNGYWWQLTRNEIDDGDEEDVVQTYADMGEEYAAVVCPAHAGFNIFMPPASSDIKLFQLVRLNGSVGIRKLAADEAWSTTRL